jgi:aspartate/methionine/tyrosine aminotransferase
MKFMPFKLKDALVGKNSPSAALHLSDSHCEPLSIRELLAFEPEALETWLESKLGYPGFRGSEPLRREIATLYPGLDTDHIAPANGADDLILAFTLSILERGDHVVVHYPAYQSLYEVARTAGCRVDLWQGNPDLGWELELDTLRSLLRPDTKLVVINTPHNPTGYAMPLEVYKELFALAEQRGFLVLSDEIYRGLELTPAAVLPPAACMSELGISMGSMSKGFGMPGLRVGWMATRNARIHEALYNFQSYANAFVNVSSEALAAIALRHREPIFERNRALIRSNLAALDEFFRRHADFFDWSSPRAGTMRFARIRRGSAEAFCEAALRQANVQIASSMRFDCGDRHVRIGFGTRGMPAALEAVERFLTSSAHLYQSGSDPLPFARPGGGA